MALSRDQILQAVDLKTSIVEVPEWGGAVNLKQLDVAGLLEFDRLRDGGKPADYLACLAALSLVDDAGVHLFTPGEARALHCKRLDILIRLGTEAIKLNGMGAADEDEAVKNS